MQNKLLASWNAQPIQKPATSPHLEKLDALSRSTECIRYSILSVEFWISPDGNMREWLRRNLRVCAWLLFPAILVMPIVGFILWQVTGWLSMLTSIMGKLIVLPILFLVALIVIKIVGALLKR